MNVTTEGEKEKKSEQEREDGVHILTTRGEEEEEDIEEGVHRLTRETEEKKNVGLF